MIEQNTQFNDVLLKYTKAMAYVQDWHTNVQRWQRLYEMSHYPTAAGKRETQYSDPTFTNTVDLAVGIMLANQLRWHAYGFTPTYTEQQDTGKIEKLLEGVLSANDEREERYQRFELFQNFVRDGGGILYSVFDPEIFERAKRLVESPGAEGIDSRWVLNEVPICVKVIDPLKFFCLPGGPKRWLLAGRKENMTVLDVELIYGVQIAKYAHMTERDKSTTNGELVDIWDYVSVSDIVEDLGNGFASTEEDATPKTMHMAVRNTVMFDNIPLRGPEIMTGYNNLPYTVQFYKPTGKDPSKWQSILSPLEDSVTLLERSFNRRAYQIDVYTSLPLVTKTQPGRTINIDPGLYNSVSISPDESIEFPTWPGNSPDLQMHMDFLRSRIQQSGFSDVMFGQGNGEAAGYAMSQLGDQNRIRLEQPIKHIELLFTSWAKKTLELLDVFAKDMSICVYGRQRGVDYVEHVKIDDLDGYQVRAEVRPTFPNEQQRKVAMASQVKGMMSNYKILEKYLDEEQPEDEEQRMFIEKVTQHPASVEYAVRKELDKRAKAGDEVAAQTLQSMIQGGIAGDMGRPKDPTSGVQIPGQPSADGQPISQAIGGDVVGRSPAEVQAKMSNQRPGYTGG
jgi:hypothetical protein